MFVLLRALTRLRSQSRPFVSYYFCAFSGSACSQMSVCGRNLPQKVHKSLLFSQGCITFAHGSSKKRDVWTSFRPFRFEIPSGEMVEWSITAVLKTAVPRGTGGSNPSLSANSRNSTSYGYFLIMIGTRSIVLIPYFEIREAFYEVLLATSWLHSSQKTVFPQTWVLGAEKYYYL